MVYCFFVMCQKLYLLERVSKPDIEGFRSWPGCISTSLTRNGVRAYRAGAIHVRIFLLRIKPMVPGCCALRTKAEGRRGQGQYRDVLAINA